MADAETFEAPNAEAIARLDVNRPVLRFAGNPILVGRTCLILTTKGELVLADVSPKAYKELARRPIIGGKCWTPPTFAGGRLYCRNAAGDVVCVDLTGT